MCQIFSNSLWTFRKSKNKNWLITVFLADLKGETKCAPCTQATDRSPALLGLQNLYNFMVFCNCVYFILPTTWYFLFKQLKYFNMLLWSVFSEPFFAQSIKLLLWRLFGARICGCFLRLKLSSGSYVCITISLYDTLHCYPSDKTEKKWSTLLFIYFYFYIDRK